MIGISFKIFQNFQFTHDFHDVHLVFKLRWPIIEHNQFVDDYKSSGIKYDVYNC